VLVALALIGVAPASSSDIRDDHVHLDEGGLVMPFQEESQLGEAQAPVEEAKEEAAKEDQAQDNENVPEFPKIDEEGPPGQAAINDLKKDVQGATSVKQVKSSMKLTIQKAMADKKADLLEKASKAADENTEKAAEKKAERQARRDIEEEETKARQKAEERNAEAEAAKAKLMLEKKQVKHARDAIANSAKGESLMYQRKAAEEGAKTATAERIAAEERAKTSAAERVASEEEAKKAAALRLTQEEQARAAQKSPLELHAMEAKAFQQAAQLKIREGEALAKVAALKSGSDLQHTEDKDVAKEATAKSALHEAKVKLHHLVERATAALFSAKAKPFDKSALQEVIDMKEKVSAAKAEVVKLAQSVKVDKESVRHDEDEIKTTEGKEEQENEEDIHHDEGKENDPEEERSEFEKDEKHEKHFDLKHPDIRHMTDEQVKYWANKKMKWRNEDPMSKNKVMAKIFQLKDMEAQTLTKMNEVNTQIGMNTTGVRASALAKGENVIVGDELVKPNPSFHLNHVFQGQKGRDPRTEEVGRDANEDDMKSVSDEDLEDEVRQIHANGQKQVDVAIAARTPPYARPGSQMAPVNGLLDLKKSVKQNMNLMRNDHVSKEEQDEQAKVATEATQQKDEEEPSKPSTSLGEDDDDNTNNQSDDGDENESIVEREDDDALTDDTDVSEAMDETSMMDDIGSVENDVPERS